MSNNLTQKNMKSKTWEFSKVNFDYDDLIPIICGEN